MVLLNECPFISDRPFAFYRASCQDTDQSLARQDPAYNIGFREELGTVG